MAVEEFDLRREGDGFLYLWPQIGYGIAFDQLADSRYGLAGEIHVRTVVPMSSTGRPGHVYQSRYNLSSGPDRDKLAKSLGERSRDVPWRDMLEVACVETLRLHRRGEPVVDLANVDLVPQRYLVAGMVPQGETTVFHGDGASTKSLTSLAAALAVTTGYEIGPFVPASSPCDVMVLDWETTKEEQAERLARICAGHGLPQRPSIHYRPMWRPLVDEIDVVRQEVQERKVGLVLVDSIGPAIGGEMDAEHTIPFYNALRALGPSVTRIVVSHISKEDSRKESGVGDPFGSIFVKNLARSVWAVIRADGVDDCLAEVGLFHKKVNRGPKQKPVGVRVRFDDPTGPISLERISIMDSPDLIQHSTAGDRLYAALRDGVKSTSELVEETGMSKPTILRTLQRRRDEFGKWGGGGRGNEAKWGLLASEEIR